MPQSSRLGDAGRAVRAVLGNAALRRIEAAFLGFNLAEYGTWIAILVFANDVTGPASVGIVAVAQLLPSAAFAPVAAGLGDRFPRARVLLGGYLAMGFALLAVGVAMAAGAGPVVVYPLAIVAAATMTLPRPMQAAITPSFASRPEELTAANGLNAVFESLGILGGPLAAALLMTVAGPPVVFFAGGAVCLASAVLVVGLSAGMPPQPVPATPQQGTAPPTNRAPSWLAGMRSVLGNPTEAFVVALLGSRFAVVGALDVLIVLLATEALGLSGASAGYLGAAIGLGGVVGGIVSLVVVGRRGLAGWMVIASMGTGLALLLVTMPATIAPIALFLAAAGVGLACLDVSGRTLLQRVTRGDLLAGVFGVVEGSAMLGLAAGSLAASLLYETVGLQGAMVAAAALLPAIALVAWLPLRRTDAALDVPARQIGLLRGLPLFSLVPPPSLEAAAARLIRFEVPAGAIVFSEGDPGDRFYVVGAGSVAVIQGGRTVRALGPGTAFGEIALLRDVPRTATVAATTDTELWALDRDPFLVAITGSPQAIAEADAHATRLLATDMGLPT